MCSLVGACREENSAKLWKALHNSTGVANPSRIQFCHCRLPLFFSIYYSLALPLRQNFKGSAAVSSMYLYAGKCGAGTQAYTCSMQACVCAAYAHGHWGLIVCSTAPKICLIDSKRVGLAIFVIVASEYLQNMTVRDN